MIIAVVGGQDCPEELLQHAEQAGREIARRGHTLICGGGGGVMEAACRGARDEGGHTIGVLPGVDRAGSNGFVEFAIVTGIGYARNVVIILSADAVIAIDGSYGTLSEIAYAHQFGKPVVGLDTWSFAVAGIEDLAMLRASTPVEAVDLAIEAVETLVST